jgi:putative CRISPR-associated protein (TIGR02619 family)
LIKIGIIRNEETLTEKKMKKLRVFVSPCGTSLLTNQVDSQLRQKLATTANYKETDFTKEEKEEIWQHIQQRKQKILDLSDLSKVKEISAELNGILTYYQDKIPKRTGRPDYHYLLISDTYQGEQVGEIIKSWLENQELMVVIVKIPDLATKNRDNFRVAMSELIKWCHSTLTGYRDSDYQVIFNLTGGFKSVQGFLQTIGMFYADECVYIFQFSSQLLTIPRLPISLDSEGIVEKNLTIFRKLALGFSVSKEDCKAIPETLLFFLETEKQISLSEWGELIWLEAKNRYYQEDLLPPLSDKLVYSDEFKEQLKNLQKRPDRINIINNQCDKLSRYLDSNRQENLKSLDFKTLTNPPFLDSTHECDAWSDQDAQRLYGHNLSNGQYMIDRLGQALH